MHFATVRCWFSKVAISSRNVKPTPGNQNEHEVFIHLAALSFILWSVFKNNRDRVVYIHGKELHVTNHRYSKHILPVSWSFVSERTFSLTFPSMPTPASAAWIILTSFPPSPKIKLRKDTYHWRVTMAWKPLYLGAHISLRRSDSTTTRSELMHTRSRHVVREWAVSAASNCIMGLFWGTNFHAVSCATSQ